MTARLLSAAIVAACLGCAAAAQQQTGAPAGIAASPVPAVASSRSTPTDAPQAFHYRVRVVDGRNGAAVRNAHVKLWYDEPAGPGYEFATDPQGYGNLPAPVGEPIRVLVNITDYTDCRRPMRDDPPKAYNLQTITTAGIAGQNGCGRVATRTSPGELVLYVRPARWYEGLNRTSGN